MSFTVNYDDAFEGNDLIPQGDYEVIVKKAEEKETKNGDKKYISIQLAVRNDIDQKYKNKVIFESMFKKKDTGKYIPKQFNSVAKALKIPNGKNYNSLDELLDDWENKTARVRIKHEEYNGNTNARVSFWNESKFSECNHVWKDQTATSIAGDAGFTPLSGQDDDFPW